jgi:hypothetical protein
MKTIGYDIKTTKFLGLQIREPADPAAFFEEVDKKDFKGLIIYHGTSSENHPGKGTNLLTTFFLPMATSRRCAVLLVDTSVNPRPKECDSPYIHLYSVSVPSDLPPDRNPFTPLIKRLVDKFEQLGDLPDEEAMQTLWAEVDPFEDRLRQLELLERVLATRKGDEEQVPANYTKDLSPYFGADMSYSRLYRRYCELCEKDDLKKK